MNLKEHLNPHLHNELFKYLDGENHDITRVRDELRMSLAAVSGMFLLRAPSERGYDKELSKHIGLELCRTYAGKAARRMRL